MERLDMNQIHLSAPDVGFDEHQAVSRAMSSGWIAPIGPEIDAFETEMAHRIGVRHAIALSSGTAALHLGLLSAGVGPGMVVPTSTLTFAATANAIRYTGAVPFFVDSDPATGNIDPELLDEALVDLARAGASIGAILPVDIFGKAADYTRLEQIAAAHGVPLLCDSAESVGSTHQGRPTGSFGLASAFSFNGNKIMTTSGGGMLLTDDDDVAITARRLSTQARLPVPHYEHSEIGYNYRLSNVLAALGRAQLNRLDEMVARRRQIRSRYQDALAQVPDVTVLGSDDDRADNCWLTCLVLHDERRLTIHDLGASFAAADIETRRLWKPMHQQPAFREHGSLQNGVSDRLFESGLSLPSGSGMSDDDVDRICAVLVQALEVPNVPA